MAGAALLTGCTSGAERSNVVHRGAMSIVTDRDARYAIPTIFMRQDSILQPDVAATYPTFRPARLAGSSCAGWFGSPAEAPCATFDFWIQDGTDLPDLPTGVDRPIPEIDPAIHRVPGPHLSLLVRFTRKRAVGSCNLLARRDGVEDGVCSEHLGLSTGDFANFDFPYHLRGRLASIEAGVAALTAAFAINSASAKPDSHARASAASNP